MNQIRELRTYISAIATAPILIMLFNDTVLRTFSSYLRSPYSLFTIAMMVLYILLFVKGYFNKIRNPNTQVLLKTAIVNLPAVPALMNVIIARNAANFVPVVFIYIFFGVIACVYQIVAGGRVGAVQRISFFVVGYLLSLIIYTGSLAGQKAGIDFSLTQAFDNMAGIASVFGYLPKRTPLPLADIIRAAMMFAIPAITFSAIAAQVRQTEVRVSPTSEPKFVNSLRPAVALLTVFSILVIFPVLFAARTLAEWTPSLTTVLPPLVVAALLWTIIIVTEGPS